MNSQIQIPTIASTWLAVAEGPITDELLEWPADLFALTNVILERSEAYRFTLSPPSGVEWPPRRFPSWSDEVVEASGQWGAWVEDRDSAFPDLLAEEWGVFRERVETPLEHLADGRDWLLCEALLTLHAVADEASSISISRNLDACWILRDFEFLAVNAEGAYVAVAEVRRKHESVVGRDGGPAELGRQPRACINFHQRADADIAILVDRC